MGKDQKTTMGKDQNGVFHPGKGKPSGINKQEGLGLHPTSPENLKQYLEVTDKYTLGEDELQPSVPVRHKNRNTSKGEDNFKGKENKSESYKSKNETMTEERSTTVAEELPGVLTKEVFSELANYKAECCVSVFLPTHAAGVEVNEHFDMINFKNTLQDIGKKLADKGVGATTIQSMLEPGFNLVRDDAFWNAQSNGLACFISEGYFKYVKMPMTPDQEVIYEPTFYVTPLVPMMMSSEYFYLLTISKQSAKLFKGDAYGLQYINIPDLPQSIEEVKRVSGLDATTYRSSESGRRAPAAAMPGSVHGGGGGNPDGKDNILTYFEAVDDVLWDAVFKNENAPLLLAAVEYEIPMYKSCADYHNIWPVALTGNRDSQETGALFADAKEVMKPYFAQRCTKALEMYGNKSATELTSSIVADVIPATYYGRVSHLFVQKGEHLWGTFDEMANEIKMHGSPDDGGEDLIDNAVVKTLSTGGEVFLLSKEEMPDDSPIAAIFRY
ncbi:MAG: hypothetical protein JWQ96_693 [Segetibacter sp.]|nr:hypothetical protein [Segetibacter sp.]